VYSHAILGAPGVRYDLKDFILFGGLLGYSVDFGYALIPIKDQLVEAQISLLFLKVRPRNWKLGQGTEALYHVHTAVRCVEAYGLQLSIHADAGIKIDYGYRLDR